MIERFPETLAMVGLAPGAEIPAWAESASIFSITATATETSLICARRSVPKKAPQHGPLTAFLVKDGDLRILTALGDIDVKVISTYAVLWVLVPIEHADAAEEAWRRSGQDVAPAVPA
ncbi:MAG TPA: hypothetical protein VN108_02375 [Marmoricola sp.]|nr:hypothetical protein [Marmoricola sp.]